MMKVYLDDYHYLHERQGSLSWLFIDFNTKYVFIYLKNLKVSLYFVKETESEK